MSITNIRTRQIIKIDQDELMAVIGAAMGGTPAINHDGSLLKFVDLPDGTLGTPAFIWNSCYQDRLFADLPSTLVVMLDILGEQLSVQTMFIDEACKE